MSKWALWAAHRYLEPVAAPRQTGPDGRPLLRPWRQRTPEARATAMQLRAARPRPWWPRLVGFALLGVAGFHALGLVGPTSGDRGANRPAGTGLPSAHLAALAPAGSVARADLVRFAWRADGVEGPFTVVLLDAGYGELARRGGIAATECSADGALAEHLASGQIRHWYVLGDRHGKPVASPVVRLEIP